MNKKRRFTGIHILIALFFISIVSFFASCEKLRNFGQSEPTGADLIQWIEIQGGTYEMGSPPDSGDKTERPRHTEKIETFEISKTEITVAQYAKCVEKKVCWSNPGDLHAFCNRGKEKKSNHPMNCVDWHQAAVFCAWAGGRLLTEAEWEYVASSRGKKITYPWGNGPINCDYATIDEKSGVGCGKWKNSTTPVCSKSLGNNEQGVCDLVGNVYEWVYDWYHHGYEPMKLKDIPTFYNGKTKLTTYHRAMRGGGIGSNVDYRVTNRTFHDPGFKYSGLGIRCAR